MGAVGDVVDDLLVDAVVLAVVVADERLASTLCAVIVPVSLLDPPVDEEPQHVGGEVQRQNDEVEQVVVVQQVDADS